MVHQVDQGIETLRFSDLSNFFLNIFERMIISNFCVVARSNLEKKLFTEKSPLAHLIFETIRKLEARDGLETHIDVFLLVLNV